MLCIVHCILYVVYCVLHIVHCILYVAHCVVYIVGCVLCIVFSTLYTVFWAVVARLVPGYAAHRRWLKLHGQALHGPRFASAGD